MREHSVSRTLVKSPPELWAEVSDPAALARHLGEFGEISITRAEPERSVAWEGERARGTVALEPAGWGTRVTLAVVADEVATEEPEATAAEAEARPEPAPVAAEEPPERVAVVAEEPPESVAVVAEAPPEPAPVPVAPLPPAPAGGGLFARLFRRRRVVEPVVEEPVVAAPIVEEPVVEEPMAEEPEPVAEEPPPPEPVAEEPEPVAEEPPPPEPVAEEPEPGPPSHIEAVLMATLDTLGGAHHRPFSRG